MNIPSLKEMVIGDKKVNFSFYRDGQLWYSAECGFQFPVPIDDTETGIFKAQDRAILFMRWMKRHKDMIEKGQYYA